jgi:hypothetical protein
MGAMRNSHKILVGKQTNIPLGRPSRKWDNIKIGLKEIQCAGMDWIYVTLEYGAVAGSCEHGNEPSENFLIN